MGPVVAVAAVAGIGFAIDKHNNPTYSSTSRVEEREGLDKFNIETCRSGTYDLNEQFYQVSLNQRSK
jgi:hypothetical protein